VPAIGFLRSSPSAGFEHLVAAFRQGLREAGFVEGRDCAIEYRWADDKFDRLPAPVADLLRRLITVIVANTPGAIAAKAATTTVPIVFATGGDPVRLGDGPSPPRRGLAGRMKSSGSLIAGGFNARSMLMMWVSRPPSDPSTLP